MKCPDINQLIEFVVDDQPCVEVKAHLLVCPTCMADVHLLQEIPGALQSEIEVPEQLVQRAMAGIPFPESRPKAHLVSPSQRVVTGVLGVLTTFAALVVTGAGGSGRPIDMLLFSLLGGVGAVIVLARRGREFEPQEPGPPEGRAT